MKYELVEPTDALFNPIKAKDMFSVQIKKALNDITSAAKATIQLEAPVGGTSQLRNTIRSIIGERTGQVVTGVNYAVFVEGGRRRKRTPPPFRPLMRWLRSSRKGVALFAKMRAGRKGRKKLTLKSAAIILAKSIGKKGIRKNPFFQRGIDKVQPIINNVRRVLTSNIRKGLMS